MQRNNKMKKEQQTKTNTNVDPTVEERIFDTLYGLDTKNKIKEWKIRAMNKGIYSIINYTYGMISGRKVECIITITNGKNIGKRNQTTHFEQAVLDATSKWKKKIESGYTTDLSKIQNNLNNINESKNKQKKSPSKNANNIDINLTTMLQQSTIAQASTTQLSTTPQVTTHLFPMLAQEYKKHKSKLKYPCYIQPKLDGYRMIYDHHTKRALTRTGKEFKILYETPLYKELITTNLMFDGELYLHNCKFENYGILRKTKALTPKERELLNQIEYHVYDIAYPTFPYKERKFYLEQFFINNPNLKMIKFVKTEVCNEETDIKRYHDEYISNNYEGSILRNGDGLYKFKTRSFDLLKNKDFYDEEFEIIDFTTEREQNDKNLIVWICKSGDKIFNVRPKGDIQEREQLYKRGAEFIGKRLWVKFFEYTDAGIPRFPTTMRSSFTEYIRDSIL